MALGQPLRQAGLRAKGKRKFKATTDSNHAHPIAENLLHQRFQAARPNQVWLSDLTYIRTQEGWLYLAAVLDLYTREIVARGQPLGWALGARMTLQLVIAALRMAWFRKHPGKHMGLVFHSDRGSQYASLAFRKALKDYGMMQSMSGAGNCFDNSPRGSPRAMESFWHSLKVGDVHGRNFATREDATHAIVIYIEAFYNCARRHSSIGYLAPRQFEKQFYQQQNLNQNNSVKQSTNT